MLSALSHPLGALYFTAVAEEADPVTTQQTPAHVLWSGPALTTGSSISVKLELNEATRQSEELEVGEESEVLKPRVLKEVGALEYALGLGYPLTDTLFNLNRSIFYLEDLSPEVVQKRRLGFLEVVHRFLHSSWFVA